MIFGIIKKGRKYQDPSSSSHWFTDTGCPPNESISPRIRVTSVWALTMSDAAQPPRKLSEGLELFPSPAIACWRPERLLHATGDPRAAAEAVLANL